MIWLWVKALTVKDLQDRRTKLLKALHYEERVYLCNYYQLKESQFCQAYTHKLWNLSANTTQRNKGYYTVVKERLYKHSPLSKAVQIIADQTADLGCGYNARIK
jgi:murein L,D-transpeptidase YafK